MVPNQAINPLIIRDSVPRPELNDDLLGAVPAQSALDIIEQKDVIGIRIKLKIRF